MSESGLPGGWEVRRSNTKNLPYYFNPDTKESRWEPPEGTDPERLKQYMADYHTSKAPSSNTQPQEGKIRCAHLLVKHQGSRRPASWREAKITRTKEEARARIAEFERQINEEGVRLGTIATTESDCSSARKGGDLGFFGRGDMQKEFEDAAFALGKNQVSHIVETASGLHLIERLD